MRARNFIVSTMKMTTKKNKKSKLLANRQLFKITGALFFQFKCISKPWKTLIFDPYFKIKHLNRSKNDLNSQKLLISQCCPKDCKYHMYSLNLSSDQPVENVRKLDFPLISRPYMCSITCSCNGLVVMMVYENIEGEDDIYLLWTPPRENQFGHMGLCYDSTSGDYKILYILRDIDSTGKILALKSGSWRNIDKHPRGICSYDMVYRDIPLPEQLLCLKGYIYIGVSVLDGMLCAYSTSNLPTKGTFKLWVLKDYGVKKY
ncbi:hypothetical protein R3W88_028443 [Solanum pinnatisectum]|uniref:F-box associated domain-containing protein n=1 Tax=Solanum pinnatisectum TaxID=50273 RepID=A0AAV9K3K7_9SOLN|nr:hypothetical protein R3W88_028443 [Solanum pinnatisectum]